MAWVVTPTAPTDGLKGVSVQPTFTWTKSGSGDRLRLVVSRLVTLLDPVLDVFLPTELTYTISGFSLDNNTLYYWAVYDETTGIPTPWSFTTIQEKPILASPSIGEIDVAVLPTCSWSAIDGSTVFDLQLAEASDFSGSEGVDLWTYTDISATSKLLTSSLPVDTKIYWRVRAVDGTDDGPWTNGGDYFNTTYGTPANPVLVSPDDTATDVDLLDTLTWTATSGALTYDVYVDTNNSFPDPPIATGVTNIFFTIPVGKLNNDTLYYWKIVSNNSAGSGTSSTRSFTTIKADVPTKSTITTPTDGETLDTSTPTITWSASTGATRYHVQISDASDFSNIVDEDVAVPTSSYIPDPLTLDDIYYIRVRGVNDIYGGPWSDTVSFVLPVGVQPGKPTLIYPVGLVDVPIEFTFDWSDTNNTDSWELEVALNSDFTNVVIGIQILYASGSEFLIPANQALEYGTEYWWRVRSVNTYTNSSWASSSFTTINTLEETPPVIVKPTQGETGVNPQNVYIGWTWSYKIASSIFHVQVATNPLFSQIVFDINTPYNLAIADLEYGQAYFTRVRASLYGNGVWTEWSVVISFFTEAIALPVKPTISKPTADETDVLVPTLIDWDPDENTNRFLLTVATDISFTDIVFGEEIAVSQHVIADLEFNTEYYVKVAGINSTGQGPDSDTVHFTTGYFEIPGLVQLVEPFDNAIDVSVEPLFKWLKGEGATSYRLEISKNGQWDIQDIVYRASGVSDLFKQIPAQFALTFNSDYWWRVLGVNAVGVSTDYMVWMFKTAYDPIPDKVVLILPENYAGDVHHKPLFTWTDAENTSAVKYTLEIATDVDFTNIIVTKDSIFDKEYALPDVDVLDFQKRYYWRVRGVNTTDAVGVWSDVSTFIVQDIPAPLKPIILTPTYGETIASSINLTFDQALYADRHLIEIAKKASFDDLYYTKVVTGGSDTIPVTYEEEYFLRVQGLGRGGYGQWSEDWLIVTQDSPNSIPSSMDLEVKISLNVNTKLLTLTDLIAADYNAVHGLDLADVKGIFKITGPNGIIYENSGFAGDTFVSPDIDGSGPTWIKTGIALPTDTNGNVLMGAYKIEYKVDGDGDDDADYFFDKTYSHLYVAPTPVITKTELITQSYMLISDGTNYAVSVGGQDYTPGSTTRDISTIWPGLSGKPDSNTSNTTLQLGPNIWTGPYQHTLTTDITYALPGVTDLTAEVVDRIITTTIHTVYIDNCEATVETCLRTLTVQYESEKQYDLTRAQVTKHILDDISLYYDMYKMASNTGADTTYSCDKLRELLTECGCLDTGDQAVEEIQPTQAETAKFEDVVLDAQGKDTWTLPFVFTTNSVVMINGDTILNSQVEATSFGTNVLVLKNTQPIGTTIVVLENA